VEDRKPEELEGTIPLGPDVDEYLDQIEEYGKAGYTHLAIHQIGPDQEGFLAFVQSELLAGIRA
jgi:hypothetical protein